MPITNQLRFDQAISRFDALNAEDPNQECAGGQQYAKELLYAHRMAMMLKRYASEASEVLQLAARCQHIQRWKIARTSYPMTKAGYHQWRNELKEFHANTAQTILREVGYDAQTTADVSALVRKKQLQSDGDAQILEDVVVLVFLESYLEQFVASHSDYDEAKFTDILRKTLKKMSARARASIFSMTSLPPALVPLILKIVDEVD